MTDLVTVGETMASLTAVRPGPLASGAMLRLGAAGAEANVAIGVSRLGHSSAWIGRLGSDQLGEMILSVLRAEGVDTRAVVRDPDHATGLMLREMRVAGRIRAQYYRRSFAGAQLVPDDLDLGLLRQATVLHVTGITLALGAGPRSAVRRAIEAAREVESIISLDVNYRALLWDRDAAADELRSVMSEVDILFAGRDEAAILVGDEGDDLAVLGRLAELGPARVVLKLGDAGAVGLEEGSLAEAPALPVTVVDPIGAGDAFVAGYLSGVLRDLPHHERLSLGVRCGAFCVAVEGDWEGLPRADEIDLLAAEDVTR